MMAELFMNKLQIPMASSTISLGLMLPDHYRCETITSLCPAISPGPSTASCQADRSKGRPCARVWLGTTLPSAKLCLLLNLCSYNIISSKISNGEL